MHGNDSWWMVIAPLEVVSDTAIAQARADTSKQQRARADPCPAAADRGDEYDTAAGGQASVRGAQANLHRRRCPQRCWRVDVSYAHADHELCAQGSAALQELAIGRSYAPERSRMSTAWISP